MKLKDFMCIGTDLPYAFYTLWFDPFFVSPFPLSISFFWDPRMCRAIIY